ALAVDKLSREPIFKQGNSNRLELCLSAKRQYELGLLVQRRDRLEGKHQGWKALADRLGRWKAAVQDWKGKKLPYTLGVVDVTLVMLLIDRLGLAEYVSPEALYEQVRSLISR